MLLTLYEEHNWYILISRCDNLKPLAVVMVVIVAPGLVPYKFESNEVWSYTAAIGS